MIARIFLFSEKLSLIFAHARKKVCLSFMKNTPFSVPLIIQGFFVFLSFFNVYYLTANICPFPYLRQTRTHKRINNPAYTEKPFPYHLKRKSDRKRLFFLHIRKVFFMNKNEQTNPLVQSIKKGFIKNAGVSK